jgi:hypothetical protein
MPRSFPGRTPDFGDCPGHLHAGPSRPYQREREPIPLPRRVDLDLHDLERFQKFRPKRSGADVAGQDHPLILLH